MHPKPDADSEFFSRPKSTPWYRAFSSLGRLMTVVALSGLALAAFSRDDRPKTPMPGQRNLPPGQRAPGFRQQSPVPSAVDRFIIVAPPGIDDAMIVPARVGIDEAMIVSPGRIRTGPRAALPILPPAANGRTPLSPWQAPPQGWHGR